MSVISAIKPSVLAGTSTTTLLDIHKVRRDFPTWHFPMVNDQPRNGAIERAIASLDLTGKTVVEIGTGTGLVALLFAKYGAARVITCEMNSNLADVAQRIINKTPYMDKITVCNESSTMALAKGFLPMQPDVIFTETLDCGVVGEGFMPIADDIAKFAGPDTLIMPILVEQTVQLISSESLANCNRAGFALGFDLSDLNEFSTGNYFPVHSELHDHAFLSAPQHLRSYTYLDCPQGETKSFAISQSGTLHGLLSWFTADFHGARVSNEPRSGSHWHQAYHPLPRDIRVSKGDIVMVSLDDEGFASVVPA
jgi:type I protein arginine methyltransferase